MLYEFYVPIYMLRFMMTSVSMFTEAEIIVLTWLQKQNFYPLNIIFKGTDWLYKKIDLVLHVWK